MYADITIKARCENHAEAESILSGLNAAYQGEDVQTDTYYETDYGKLKHRQGNIENVLIHYNRTPLEGAKRTEVLLYLKNPGAATVAAVCEGKSIIARLKKIRKIYFIDNVKFHLDQIKGLGDFIEIEAIDLEGSVGIEVLQQQCDYYKDLLQIHNEDLVTSAYTDLIHHS
ncbi:putative adenylyl cyclase CyaB [Pontibacter aydingkolensis]|uniref:Class IV adenylate cyclase n=1 Tax=Pontibacter aydingkolensis TaxID=1911536 RepID=A0ABS7CYN8_9BACT|nr:class IV adenylate cyclase [Pontibacter aydingkolensis]MBW7468935.1 class IV adenylate cyclase [Pontibacter aydingkolensis]